MYEEQNENVNNVVPGHVVVSDTDVLQGEQREKERER